MNFLGQDGVNVQRGTKKYSDRDACSATENAVKVRDLGREGGLAFQRSPWENPASLRRSWIAIGQALLSRRQHAGTCGDVSATRHSEEPPMHVDLQRRRKTLATNWSVSTAAMGVANRKGHSSRTRRVEEKLLWRRTASALAECQDDIHPCQYRSLMFSRTLRRGSKYEGAWRWRVANSMQQSG